MHVCVCLCASYMCVCVCVCASCMHACVCMFRGVILGGANLYPSSCSWRVSARGEIAEMRVIHGRAEAASHSLAIVYTSTLFPIPLSFSFLLFFAVFPFSSLFFSSHCLFISLSLSFSHTLSVSLYMIYIQGVTCWGDGGIIPPLVFKSLPLLNECYPRGGPHQ